jgi:hypothetical protein
LQPLEGTGSDIQNVQCRRGWRMDEEYRNKKCGAKDKNSSVLRKR